MDRFGDIGDYLVNIGRIDYVRKKKGDPTQKPAIFFAHSSPLELSDDQLDCLVSLMASSTIIVNPPGPLFAAGEHIEYVEDHPGSSETTRSE
jgi:hypothetical protein